MGLAQDTKGVSVTGGGVLRVSKAPSKALYLEMISVLWLQG